MSLIQHVSSVEGVDQEPLEEFGHTLERQQSHHTLSYDPIPSGPEGFQDKLEAQAAYEVSQLKRIGELLSRLFHVLDHTMTDLSFSSDNCGSHHMCHCFRYRLWF